MSKTDKIYIALSTIGILWTLQFVLDNDLVWDDVPLIKAYPALGEPSQIISSATEPFWQNSASQPEQLTSFWRPLTSLLLSVTASIFGRRPSAFHGVSIVCLFGAAFALFRMLSRLLPKENRTVAAFTAAAIFSIHPLSVEVLCMAANISDHLALMFLLYATLQYFDYFGNTDRNIKLVSAALFGFLALTAKETGVVFLLCPLVALMLKRSTGVDLSVKRLRSLRLIASALLPLLLFFVLRGIVMHHSGAADNLGQKLGAISPVAFVLGIGQAFIRTCLPIPQGAHAYISATDPLVWLTVVAHVAVILFLGFRSRRNGRLSLAPIGLLLGILLTVPSFAALDEFHLGFRFPTRYFHLYLAGLMIALAPIIRAKWNAGLRYAAPVLLALFGLLSWMRIDEWRTNLTFAYAEAAYHPNGINEILNLTSALVGAGHYDKAEVELDKLADTSDINLPYYRALELGCRSDIAILRDGDFKAATRLAETALTIRPYNLDNVIRLADARALDNRPDQSMTILKKALTAPWFSPAQKTEIERHMVYLKQVSQKRN